MNNRLIGVKFGNQGFETEYVFDCYDDVKLGDKVVVDTCNGFAIATVTNLEAFLPSGNALREVVCIVNTKAFEERKAKTALLKKLKSRIDKRVKKIQEMSLYEMLAEKDPELKALVSELKELI